MRVPEEMGYSNGKEGKDQDEYGSQIRRRPLEMDFRLRHGLAETRWRGNHVQDEKNGAKRL